MSRALRLHAISIGLLSGMIACLDPFEPDVGPPVHAACSNEDIDLDNPVSFADDIASGMVDSRCANCHSPSGDNPIGFDATGLDLSTYAGLRSGGVTSGTDIVIPGSPCPSTLVEKTGEAPPFGARMPLGGPPFLTLQQREQIHDWIVEGGLDN